MLNIEIRGTENEKTYISKVIMPLGALQEHKEATATNTRNYFLDILVLGHDEYQAFRHGKPTKEASVMLQIYKPSLRHIMLYDTHGRFKSMDEKHIDDLIERDQIDEKVIISLSPKNTRLTYHGDLTKAKVLLADERSILFGYALTDRHLNDVPFIVKMFYNPGMHLRG